MKESTPITQKKPQTEPLETSFEFSPSKLPSVSIFRILFTLMSKTQLFLFILAVLGSIGVGISLQVREYLMGNILTELTSTDDKDKIDDGVHKITVYYAILCVLSLLFSYLMMGLFGYLSKSLIYKYKVEYYNLVIGMNQTWFDRTGKSPFELGNQMILELTSIEAALGQIIGNLVEEISSLIFGVVLSLVLSWKIALVLMTIYPVWIGVQVYTMVSVEKVSGRKRFLLEKVGGYLEEILYKIKTVASFANFDYERKNFNNEIDVVLKNNKRLTIRMSISNGMGYFLNYLMMMMAFGFGGLFLSRAIRNKEELDVGKFYSVLSLVAGAGNQMGEMIPNLRRLSECCSSAKILFELRRYRSDKKNQTSSTSYLIHNELNDRKVRLSNFKGKLNFKNVTFTYPKKPTNKVLAEFNLEFPAGKTTALIGESGCGKSTIINLIERIYQPNQGEIILDDTTNIDDINLESYREQIGLVSQEPVLFNDTIKNNILIGRKIDNEDAEIESALKRAKIFKFVNSLPDKLDHVVGIKGGKLSGGQKQRLAIARALLKKPKILIFDEATSALDNKSERQIQKSINALQGEVTMVIIAHRLSTVKNADNIVVLGKGGRIIEQGSHESLMKNKGKYFSLVNQETVNKEQDKQEEANNESVDQSKKTEVTDSERILQTESKELMQKLEISHTKKPPSNNGLSSFTKFMLAVKPHKCYFIIGMILSLISGFIHPFIGTLFGAGIDKLSSDDPDEVQKQGNRYAYIFIACTVLGSALEMARYYFFDFLGEMISVEFKKKIFATFLRLHPGFYDNKENSPGTLVSQMAIKTDAINGVVLTLLAMIVQAIGNIISSTALGAVYDYRITLINFAFIPFMILCNFFMIIANSKEEHRRLNSKYGDVLSENLGNVLTIASFNAYEKSSEAIRNVTYKGSEDDFKYSSMTGFFFGLDTSLIGLAMLVTFYAAGKYYINGSLTMGNFLKAVNSIGSGMFFIELAMKYIKDINLMKEAINGLYEQTELKSEIDPETKGKKLIADKSLFHSKIEFRNVKFAYPTNPHQMILKGVSFVINPGEKIGFIGASGAGKSTITQLLERFYDPVEGEILINDVNIKDYDLKSLRQMISYVQQEPNLFTRTTMENIRYGNLSASDEEIRQCAVKCKIDHKLNTKIDNKIDLIDSEHNDVLSGGEKQRVAIARALIHEPKVLLLDEATSALDNKTENEIQTMLDSIIQGEKMTVIVIAHRLRVVKECDKCFLMQNGRITLTGSLEEIMKVYK